MHGSHCFNERVLKKTRGKTCYSLWLNKQNLLGAWLLGFQGQNRRAKSHVVPGTLNRQPRTKNRWTVTWGLVWKIKTFTLYWVHLSFHMYIYPDIWLSLYPTSALTSHTFLVKGWQFIGVEKYHPITVRQGIGSHHIRLQKEKKMVTNVELLVNSLIGESPQVILMEHLSNHHWYLSS